MKSKKENRITQKIKKELKNKNPRVLKLFKIPKNKFVIAQKGSAFKPKSVDIRIKTSVADRRHILIENKCFGASLQPRQKLLYVNVFADALRTLKTEKCELYFIVEKTPQDFLKKCCHYLNENKNELLKRVKIKSKLKELLLCKDPQIIGRQLKVTFKGKYRGEKFQKIKITARAIRFSDYIEASQPV